ncbi:hypothetical protein KY309_01055 [Candidatus Woesearchaeota archaeon]|nr:hypothetical protein [Candidatus Woesearchaeota archaeon]MBW3016182.1 hypothetical protein [Candidatus Woesearchaeota archaeon]
MNDTTKGIIVIALGALGTIGFYVSNWLTKEKQIRAPTAQVQYDKNNVVVKYSQEDSPLAAEDVFADREAYNGFINDLVMPLQRTYRTELKERGLRHFSPYHVKQIFAMADRDVKTSELEERIDDAEGAAQGKAGVLTMAEVRYAANKLKLATAKGPEQIKTEFPIDFPEENVDEIEVDEWARLQTRAYGNRGFGFGRSAGDPGRRPMSLNDRATWQWMYDNR